MTTKELLLEQFNACYDDSGWFVALKNALENLTPEQAGWRMAGIDHSIWETVNHLTFWNKRYLKRFQGERVDAAEIDNDTTFQAAGENISETEWQGATEKLFEVLGTWRAALEAADEEKLQSAVSEQNPSPWHEALAHQNIHNAYHTGQIVLLRKLQSSWNPGQGVS